MTSTPASGHHPISCGNCKGKHVSVEAVKQCYASARQPVAQPTPAQEQQPEGLAFLAAVRGYTTPLTDSVVAAHRSIGRVSQFEATPAQVRFIHTLHAEREVPVAGSTLEEATLIARVEDIGGGKHVSAGEASAVITWLKTLPVRDEVKTAEKAAFLPAAAPTTRALPDVPEGHYAVASRTGNNDLDFFRVDRPTEGRWAGRTFVKRVIGGKPDHPVRGAEARTALEAIFAAGPAEAGALYGREIGRCYRCNRHLTDETSRALGIGPDCRTK